MSTASPSRKTPLRAAVGDTVVYAGHGVGLVVAHEQKRVGDMERDCVVVDLADGLRITLPLQEAAERLRAARPGVDEAQIAAYIEEVRRDLEGEAATER